MKDIKQIEEYIRQECIKANPSILDLKFGCEVKAQRWNNKKTLSWKKGIFIKKDNFSGNPYILYGKNDVDYCYHNMKILGRPIELSDMILAIETNPVQDGGEVDYSAFGIIFHIGKYEKMGRNGYYSKCFYNLSLPFLQQTDETKLFIAKLLNYND